MRISKIIAYFYESIRTVMKKLIYICFVFGVMTIISCDKNEVESPAGEAHAKSLGIEETRTESTNLRERMQNDIRSGGDEINDDGDDETGNQPPKKD